MRKVRIGGRKAGKIKKLVFLQKKPEYKRFPVKK